MLLAAQYWKKALEACPWRLDLYYRLAYLYQDLGDFESQYGTLVESFKYASRNMRKLRWINGQALPQPPNRFIPGAQQDFEAYYLAQEDPLEREKALRLCRLTLTFYPRHSRPYNSIAAYFALKQDWPRTFRYLLTAKKINPRDSLVLDNIGSTLLGLGKKRIAAIYFKKVLALGGDPPNEEFAREQLKKIQAP
jgi:tetratricopeptide (TPR) repeat protein